MDSQTDRMGADADCGNEAGMSEALNDAASRDY